MLTIDSLAFDEIKKGSFADKIAWNVGSGRGEPKRSLRQQCARPCDSRGLAHALFYCRGCRTICADRCSIDKDFRPPFHGQRWSRVGKAAIDWTDGRTDTYLRSRAPYITRSRNKLLCEQCGTARSAANFFSHPRREATQAGCLLQKENAGLDCNYQRRDRSLE